LKNITSDFSKDWFDPLVEDIRDYAKLIEIEHYIIDDDFPEKPYYRGSCNYKILGQLRPAMKFEFNENDSLRDRMKFVIDNPLLKLNFDYEKLFQFSDIAEREYKRVTEAILLKTESKKQQPPKQPITFAGLFISPCSEKIDLLLEKLSDIGLTKTNNNWREWQTGKVEKNETSKFYYYLKQKNVLNEYDKTPALICFNEKFGIEVYKDKETPKTERFVQIKTLTSSEKTTTKTNLLDKFDVVFNKWIEKIPLK